MGQVAEPNATTLNERLLDVLRPLADPAQAESMRAYMKSEMPFLGIKKPVLTAAVRPILKDTGFDEAADWRETVLDTFRTAQYREQWYVGLLLLRSKARRYLDLEALPMLEAVIVETAWWDIVDEVASHHVGHLLATHRDQMTPTMRAWSTDADLWKRRTSIIAQLRHKGDVDEVLLTDVIDNNIDDKDFFIRKAIGWALRQHARIAPDLVRAFVEARRDQLSGLSRREALKHLEP